MNNHKQHPWNFNIGLTILLLLCLPLLTIAAIPTQLNYQGKLASSSGAPVTGVQTMLFRFYDAVTGGTVVWQETHPAVVVTDGIFNVLLGSVTPLALDFNQPYWVELVVNNEVLAPRQPLVSVGYAFRAKYADVAGVFDLYSTTVRHTGNYAINDFVFGSPQLVDDGDPYHDARFLFDKSKGAFRAGAVTGTQWNEANIGAYSFAAGSNTTASGQSAVALGSGATASGTNATALGDQTIASGQNATAMGYKTQSSGNGTTALGYQTTASATAATATGFGSAATGTAATASGYATTAQGNYASTYGVGTTAESFAEAVVGSYDTNYTPLSPTGWNAADRLFVVGNGSSGTARSDALVITKNGNATLKGQLTLTNGSSAYSLPNADGANGQALITNGSGAASWAMLPAGDITSVTAGPGLKGGGATGAVTVYVNTTTIQSRVTGTCPAGQSIRAVNLNGTVVCEADTGVFENNAGVVRNTGTHATDDFVFGSTQLADDGDTTHRARIYFDKSLGVFRVGYVDGTQWDTANVGPYSFAAGYNTTASGQYATVGGGNGNNASNSSDTVGGGYINTARGPDATVGGGEMNAATANDATIGGGFQNTANSAQSTVGGGWKNKATNQYAAVFGGYSSIASGQSATVGGGASNIANNTNATVGGGASNTASNTNTTVGGGVSNVANGPSATVGGGASNTASYSNTTVGGGIGNRAIGGHDATIAGGYNNLASGHQSTVGGGWKNKATNQYASVFGGYSSIASGQSATVGGGEQNTASGYDATVGGGQANTASNYYATVGGGAGNNVSGNYATVGGGDTNTASADWATVPGGYMNQATRDYSFAAGRQATAAHQGAFVWSDSTGALSSTTNNQFMVRASGGAVIYSSAGTTFGVQLAAGGGAWATISDSHAKENFAVVDARAILSAVAALPVQTWNYKTQDASIRHIGPMAQDFYAAFRVGDNDTTISTIDPDGVALAAIQGLYQELQDRDARLAAQADQIAALQAQLAAQQAQLDLFLGRLAALEQAVAPPVAAVSP